MERRNVSLQDMETFPSFPTGREKKTFPSKKEKLFPMGRKTFPNGKGNIYQQERETFERERRKLFPVGRGNIFHYKRKTFPIKIGIHFLVRRVKYFQVIKGNFSSRKIFQLEVDRFPCWRGKGFPMERENISQSERETFCSRRIHFPVGRETVSQWKTKNISHLEGF